MNKWNGKRFSIYDKEEKQVLGLLNNLGEQTNFNTDEVETVKESNNKKVSYDELHNIYKLTSDGDFKGSWQGLAKPTLSDEGLKSTVEKHIQDISSMKREYNKIDELNQIIKEIFTGEIRKIRFIGDSIGVGASAEGYGENPEGVITYNKGGDIHREPFRNVGGYVNYFRLALSQINPSIDIINASIAGRSVVEASDNMQYYTFSEGGEDLVFVALSINDLHLCKSVSEYTEKYQKIIDFLKTKSRHIVLLTPSLVYLEDLTSQQNYLKVRQLASAIMYIAKLNNLPCIDMFNDLLMEINRGTINYLNYFQTDTVHPSSEGHYVMYLILANKFGCSMNDDNFFKQRLIRFNSPNFASGVKDLAEVVPSCEIMKICFMDKGKVEIRGGMVLDNPNNVIDIDLFTIPEGYRPMKELFINAMGNTSEGTKIPVMMKLFPSGLCKIFGTYSDCSFINVETSYRV